MSTVGGWEIEELLAPTNEVLDPPVQLLESNAKKPTLGIESLASCGISWTL